MVFNVTGTRLAVNDWIGVVQMEWINELGLKIVNRGERPNWRRGASFSFIKIITFSEKLANRIIR